MGVLYTTKVRSEGGRSGRVRSSDGLLDAQLAAPKGMGGPEDATNPEQLFAAGYAACFASSVEFIAKRDGVQLGAIEVEATVALRATDAGPFVLDVTLAATLGGVSRNEAEKLVQQAHAVCPYSNAVRGNIDVQLHTAVQ